MLTQETKQKIDSARQILVGKVPDPKAQVEQITTALIYKFMDDMDKEAQELGGKARFFTNDYQKYAWTKLMDTKLGGQDRLNLYLEAITTLSQNPYLPQLFRDIFKDAFLPYRDPETLNLFLKEINGFTYEHSEDLGDAYEYLLSIMGSQGDAGMFRTPRHIIDFIVAAVDPKKDETICDPACGTAGFLISAFKHILKENKEKPLTPDERKNLMDHFVGYDISPDMVRLSKVNLYLHGFPSPTIFEYDTLSSEEKWDENFDVMLANPPFMSPKGGIRPHKRFSVQANRSEVLFVDYILEHLRPNGRAGIIVPEGIIFKSATAYKALRKLLIEDGLLAVVSLPAGVFNPYAGVKTSILLFDNGLAKKTEDILFLKIQNDGYDLGAQRRKIDKNDLPQALEIIKKYKTALKENKKFKLNEEQAKIAHLVAKEKIAESGDYNLSSDRYIKAVHFDNQKWPMVELGEICEFIGKGRRPASFATENGKTPFVVSSLEQKRCDSADYEMEALVIGDGGSANIHYLDGRFSASDHTYILKNKNEANVSLRCIYLIIRNNLEFIENGFQGQGLKNVSKKYLQSIKIPLPPLEVQKEIVEQIEVKQKAIEAAKAVIENLERERRYFGQEIRKIKDVGWAKLGDVCKIKSGGTPLKNKREYYENGTIPWLKSGEVDQGLIYKSEEMITEKGLKNSSAKLFPVNTVLVAMYGATAGKVGLLQFESTTNQAVCGILPNDRFIPEFLYMYLRTKTGEMVKLSGGGAQPNISQTIIKVLEIPLPPIEIQKQLVAEMEEQEKIIEANKKLIGIMEQKIAKVLSEI